MSDLQVLTRYKATNPDRLVRLLRSSGVGCWTEHDEHGNDVVVVSENEKSNRYDRDLVHLGMKIYADNIDYKTYEHDGKFWFDILDFNVEGEEPPTLVHCSESGWKRETTAKRHALEFVEVLRKNIVDGVAFVDWN